MCGRSFRNFCLLSSRPSSLSWLKHIHFLYSVSYEVFWYSSVDIICIHSPSLHLTFNNRTEFIKNEWSQWKYIVAHKETLWRAWNSTRGTGSSLTLIFPPLWKQYLFSQQRAFLYKLLCRYTARCLLPLWVLSLY